MDSETCKVEKWPKSFVAFLEAHGISPDIYLKSPLRYFRIMTQCPTVLESIKVELPTAMPVEWPENFYVLPSDSPIAGSTSFKKAYILPMDPSSFLAVENLSLQPGEHVLDLCCAPGTKLALISTLVCPGECNKGSVTGVDISKERLASAATLSKKYKLSRVRLFQVDGRIFDERPHEILAPYDSDGCKFDKIYSKDRRPVYTSTLYRRYPGKLSDRLYDKVLVDAQCTHDGSIKHVRKHIETDWKNYDPDHYSIEGLRSLYTMQSSLLEQGFKLLRPDGLLVYSTCSLTKEQNEAIIEEFLHRHREDATVEDPIGPKSYQVPVDKIHHALRIKPSLTMGGGFFVCRIRKLKQPPNI
jgi:16S rRNA C967 or C1407 C5-methylase (RsmB/RsmF family)